MHGGALSTKFWGYYLDPVKTGGLWKLHEDITICTALVKRNSKVLELPHSLCLRVTKVLVLQHRRKPPPLGTVSPPKLCLVSSFFDFLMTEITWCLRRGYWGEYLGVKQRLITGNWRKLYNGELHNLYALWSIITEIKSKQMRWARHVDGMEEIKIHATCM